MHPAKVVRLTIVATAAVRLVLGAAVGLGVDESYAASVARPLSLSYFDHPPLHFWIAGVTEQLARVHGASPLADLAVRAPFIALFALTTWLMYRLTADLVDERAGMYAALALNVSGVFSVSAGGWVLPDGPLMCASVAAAYCVARVVFNGGSRGWWLAAGVASGLALLSKYHGVLLIAGLFVFLLTTRTGRPWLGRPAPYLAAAIAALMFTPVILWNARHGWVSFLFQAGRGTPSHGRHVLALAQNIGGQAALVLPWVWVPLVVCWVHALRAGPRDERRWFVSCLATLPIALFTLVSLGGNPGLPHWPAPGYLFLFPLLGRAAAQRPARTVHRWLIASGAVLTVVVLAIAFVFTPDDLVDWRDLRGAVLPQGRFVAAPSWIQAGKVAWALGPDVPVLCLSPAPHQFAFTRDPAAYVGQDATLLMRPRTAVEMIPRYASMFAAITPLGELPIMRRGRPVLTVARFLARGFQRPTWNR